jgi:ketosteroid isomerase-like protein
MKNINEKAYSSLTSTEEKFRIASQFLTALNSKNWELLRSVITEDCTWSFLGTILPSGESIGADEVIIKAQYAVGMLHLGTGYIPHSLNCVALAIYKEAANGALNSDEHIAMVSTLRDGKISAISTLFSYAAAESIFSLEEHNASAGIEIFN